MTKVEARMQKVGVIESAKAGSVGIKLGARRTQFSCDAATQGLCDF